MITLINFADLSFKKKQKWNSLSAKWLGRADQVVEFTPNDIDKDFYNQNKKILDSKRGGGHWLWKPYFILKALKDIKDNEYLVYCDSGAIVLRNLNKLIQVLEQSNQSVMLFELPLLECQWTQKTVFEHFENLKHDMAFSNQIMGGFVVLKKNKISIEFIVKWLSLCCEEKLLIFQKNEESIFFKAHREDQSILSLLAKTEGIKPFSDPTDYGKFPIQYLAKDRLFNLNNRQSDLIIKKPIFLLVRKANVFLYVVNYCIKSCLKVFGLNKTSIW